MFNCSHERNPELNMCKYVFKKRKSEPNEHELILQCLCSLSAWVHVFFFFTVRVPLLLAIMPFPILRSMMSKIISKSEQGE